MSRYRGPIVRKSRRYGAMLFSNGQSKTNAFNKRKYPPGQHGRTAVRKLSEYGRQLQEKQKAKFIFGISEKQIRKYFEKADRSKEVTGVQLMRLMELRLDNTVYRAGFATTRTQSRQIVSHGLVMLNGRRVDVPSIEVKVGDVIEVRSKSQASPLFAEVKKTKKAVNPKWISVDYAKLKFEVIAQPEADDLEMTVEPQLIVEFYSK